MTNSTADQEAGRRRMTKASELVPDAAKFLLDKTEDELRAELEREREAAEQVLRLAGADKRDGED